MSEKQEKQQRKDVQERFKNFNEGLKKLQEENEVLLVPKLEFTYSGIIAKCKLIPQEEVQEQEKKLETGE